MNLFETNDFIAAIGTDLVMAAFNLALNTYFVVKRGVATGIAMSITGLGPILMPIGTSRLLWIYDDRETGMLLAALTLHSLAAALLLRPIKWYRRKPIGLFLTDLHIVSCYYLATFSPFILLFRR